ncbi:MAG TPA: cobalt-precorrin-5B (C(1))-methyltransferase [Candidatus Sulfotelmatobacter sp.]|jgi:cobalt-precorrin-5B (C1)-methyltransferase|nr:cobalt-precorrin-5B (C(1))-methyltransferase [Candidatus Sulfotelmatobacter sp.]
MEKPLRKGWTTGACAAAAAASAWRALRLGGFADPVTIALPRGDCPSFALSRAERDGDAAIAGVIKDAGDDPDITHGAEIVVRVEAAAAGSGLLFRAGEGVGRVTLPGLPLAVGEPAINPGPRAQILDNMRAVAEPVDAVVTVSIPGGDKLARQTMNPRLGIVGGLSVLGTTGIVMPYSCAAWIHSIHRGVDVARACGLEHLAGCTGKTSEDAVRRLHGLDERAMIDMGGFAGALLKYLRNHPVPRLTIGGGFAKLAKLAAGEMDLHSKAAAMDLTLLRRLLAELTADPLLREQADQAVTAAQILKIAGDIPLGDLVARRARETALAVLAGGVSVDVVLFDRAGKTVGHAG